MESVVIIMIYGIQLYLKLYGLDSSIMFLHACFFHSLKITSQSMMGKLANDDFIYASFIFQLNYLQGHFCAKITLMASQVAIYVHSPKIPYKLGVL